MKAFAIIILSFCIALHAQSPSATTIRVGLFSTAVVHGVTITPLTQQAWQQDCDACKHTPLRTPIHLEHLAAPVQFGGSIRIQPDSDTAPLEAAGLYRIAPFGNELRTTLQLPSENYVAAVLSGEAAADEPAASLEAMAIVARTFALSHAGRHASEGFDLCDSTHCQALRLGKITQPVMQAVRHTAGITLWSGSQRASVYYTQHCGGITEAAASVWPTESKPYLISHADPYCLRRSPAQWQTDIPITALLEIASREHWRLPPRLTEVHITRRTPSGRASLLAFTGNNLSATISASSLRFAINRALGWYRLRSDRYTVTLSGDHLHFNGTGYGHGVGLCQAGAFQMALEHHTSAEILAFYFPGTHIGLTSSTGAWQSQTIDDISLRTILPEPALAQATQIAANRARHLYPDTTPLSHPTITLAPTTELFRQLSSSPGYLLAVTRGDQITLQPIGILQRNGPLEPLLLHELLHAAIEKDSTDKAPLWLREGLAEALATLDAPPLPRSLPLPRIEQELASPTDLASAQQAHREAATVVRSLGRIYSVEVMRIWLRDGVPQDALSAIR